MLSFSGLRFSYLNLAADDLLLRTVSLDEPEQGLPDEILQATAVLVWWGHCAPAEVAACFRR